MGNQFSAKGDRKTRAGKFLSGASAAALLLGVAAGTARAAGTTITGTVGAVVITSLSSTDFIWIDGGTVTGSITNSGTVGASDFFDPIDPAIQVNSTLFSPGSVGGNIINTTSGVITDSETGIAILSATTANDPVGLAIINRGLIHVSDFFPATDLHGILITGTAVDSAITNSGVISVHYFTSGISTKQAVGISITSTGTLMASITNSGTINVAATASGSGSQSAQAIGVIMSNPTSIISAPAETVSFSNTGTVNVGAAAKDTFGAESFAGAVATGVSQIIAAASASTASAAFTNVTGASVNITASASITGTSIFVTDTARATVNGIRQNASGGTLTTSTFTNNGSFDMLGKAFASAPNAKASAFMGFGLSQKATATGGPGSVASAGFTNTSFLSFDVDLTATATGATFASAVAVITADFILQSASMAQTASATITNSGLISADLNANAFATGLATAAAGISGNFIRQNVDATGTGTGLAAGSATASIANSGTIILDIDAVGSAGLFGSTGAAAAFVTGDIIDQSAKVSGTGTALASFTNTSSGSVTITMDAFGKGIIAGADAVIGRSVIDQNATILVGDGSATASITNSGAFLVDMNALASGLSLATATASIGGQVVDQFAWIGGGNGTVSASFVNTSSFDVIIAATATAPLGGAGALVKLGGALIEQDALIGATAVTTNTATASILNSGSLTLDMDALTLGRSAANATAIVTGANAVIDQTASVVGTTVSGSASVSLTNTSTGLISVTLDAIFLEAGLLGSATGLARLSAGAIDQVAIGAGGPGNFATASISNSGTMLFDLGAAGFGINVGRATASIRDDAIGQSASAGSATVSLTNSNELTVRIEASATTFAGGTAAAFAAITKGSFIDQNATGTGGTGSSGSASIVNTGSILLDIDARASGSTGAVATGVVFGDVIDQRVSGETASASFTNSNSFLVLIDVSATATDGSGTALAGIGGTGIDQLASAIGGTSNAASVSIMNSGNFTLNFNANVIAQSSAFATASIGGNIVDQMALATGSGVATATFTNSGNFNALLSASASDSIGNASALAAVGSTFSGGFGINQSVLVSGSGAGQSASAGIVNSGDITFDLDATSKALTTAIATAIFWDDVISQRASLPATSTGTASASLTNTVAGNIDVTLNAAARGPTVTTNVVTASAFAVLDDGFIDQNASGGFGAGGVGTVTLANSGDITLNMSATATATAAATANAIMRDEFLAQYAEGETASVSLTNNGDFTANLDANAFATNGTATAVAEVSDQFIEQRVTASGVVTGTVSLFNDNNGTIGLTLDASATAENRAFATAILTKEAILQVAIASTPTVSLTNEGTIDFQVNARASVSDLLAFAGAAYTKNGIVQVASAVGAGTSASVTLDNSGSISFGAFASAIGSTVAGVTAGLVGDVVRQTAVAENASVLFDNSGTFTVAFTGNASAAGGVVSAIAIITDSMIDMNATGAGGTTNSATATFSNSGTLSGSLSALAIASTTAFAFAILGDDVVDMDASASGVGGSATATFTNTITGSISLDLDATATATAGLASAFAARSDGINQNATAGGAGSVGSASITNAGTITLAGDARAIGSTSAFATAMAQDVVDQEASGNTATVTFVNSGDITSTLGAFASAATGTAFALASYTRFGQAVDQSAMASGAGSVATVSMDNSGNFTISGVATAIGSKANASALFASTTTTTFGSEIIRQSAVGESASVTFTNSGTFSASLTARASATGAGPTATASALASYQGEGIEMNASATGAATTGSATLTNSGAINIGALVSATAVARALATVNFDDDVIDMNAVGASALASFTNSGTVLVTGTANASGGTAYALATMGNDGLDQNATAFGTSALASAVAVNSGTMSFTLNANAFGTKLATATAEMQDVVDQSATGWSATASFTNTVSGTLAASLNAFASATSGAARAFASFTSAGEGIEQRASATGGAGSVAIASITNAGTISFGIAASAIGTGFALAIAELSSSGAAVVDQFATGNTATVSLTNSGLFNVVLDADASATAGTARAIARFSKATAIDMSAVGTGGTGSVASATLINSGTMSFSLLADAVGFSSASAIALISSDLVNIFAFGETATASVVNSGTFSVLLDASAIDLAGNASAFALFSGDGFDINAVATVGATPSATASMTNSSILDFDVFAFASASTFARASANFSGDVIEQDAFATGPVASASSVFTNTLTGSFTVDIDATATASVGFASAVATFDDILNQDATAFGSTALASVSASNSGIISVSANASAFGVTGAFALARGQDVIDQSALSNDTATVSFTNSGSVTALIGAFASASGAATAVASYDSSGGALDQEATATGGAGSVASATFVNSGTFSATGVAWAIGSTALARAVDRSTAATGNGGDFMRQWVLGDSATASITNSGTVAAALSATATAITFAATAIASFDSSLIDQNAGTSTAVGTTGSVSINNSGTMSFSAFADANGVTGAVALANFGDGIVDQFAVGTFSASASFINSSIFRATATALASAVSGPATATAKFSDTGIEMDAGSFFTAPTTATVTFNNSGTLTFNLLASATGTSYASANATFDSEIIDMRAIGVTAVNSMTNSGDLLFNATANASAPSGSAFAYALIDDSGIDQNATGTGSGNTATITLTNTVTSTISFDLNAAATGAGFALASAAITDDVLDQDAIGGSASVTFTNDGTFEALLNATAVATAGSASAFAYMSSSGIDQSATATGGAGSTATVVLTNTSPLSIDLRAIAVATGSTGAYATAQIGTSGTSTGAGIYQSASGGEVSSVTLTNSGDINMLAGAFAKVTATAGTFLSATATATVFTGIAQWATASGGAQTSATATLTNSGDILLSAVASASAPDVASAFANIDVGIFQRVSNADTATALLTNSSGGLIDVEISAFAKGSIAFASANNTTHVIEQNVTAGDSNLSASATIDNDGTISLDIDAIAIGTDGASGAGSSARASVFVSYAIEQSASNGATSTVTLDNSGTIDLQVDALASNADFASASVDFDTGFNLDADAFSGTSDVATVTVTNSGTMKVGINATALGVFTANAYADLDYFMSGTADDASTATFSFTNTSSGTVSAQIFALAIATGAGGDAYASAAITSMFELSASASAGDQTSATVTFTNDGLIDVDVVASASAPDSATAFAEVSYGIWLDADDGDDSTATLTNTGIIDFDVRALAIGSFANASASFDDTVLFVGADASDGRDTATSTITNTSAGSITALVRATAFATDGASGTGVNASAFATIDTLIDQRAQDARTATVTLTNDGTLEFIARAFAVNASSAFASVYIGDIDQDATATGGPGSSATVTLSNSGTTSLTVMGTAIASGVTTATATASITGDFVNQSASGAVTASVALTNTGTFQAILNATAIAAGNGATGTANALATLSGTAVDQNASATGGSGSSASATFSNTTSNGTFLIDLNAFAMGTGATLFATTAINATARIGGDVVDQSASSAETATVTFTNSGIFSIQLDASAFGTVTTGTGTSAVALASIAGTVVDQNAFATGAASVGSASFTNSGTFIVDFGVVAVGSSFANASAIIGVSTTFAFDIVNQSAIGATASTSFTNSGSFTINLDATATAATGFASALAMIGGDGIVQSANATLGAGGPASATMTNSGTMAFNMVANASGATGASAAALFGGDVIRQSAIGTSASASLTNSGGLLVTLDANATAVAGTAFALAKMSNSGIDQNASASTGGASATLTNSSTILFDIDAFASGPVAFATAQIDPDLVNQIAVGTTATVSFSNTSAASLSAVLDATAFGVTFASALASMTDDGIEQDALATVGAGGAATATITNSGVIFVDLNALASATAGSASATAKIDGSMIDQFASGTSASVTLTNSGGSMTFIMDADAIGGLGFASALASFDDTGIAQSAIASFGAGGLAAASISNSGTITFAAMANASGLTGAVAVATMSSEVFDQDTFGVTASGTFTNNGSLLAMLSADAVAASGVATARAEFGSEVLEQSGINATFGAGGLATASMTNNGAITLAAMATATGGTAIGIGARATAEFNDEVVDQWARGTSASVSFTNSGSATFVAMLDADANAVSGLAFALASLGDDGVEQTASANYLGGGTATVSLTNSGSMLFDLDASANGVTGAVARATLTKDGIGQFATGNTATVSLTNSGPLSFVLEADASAAAGSATAFAIIGETGIEQDALATFLGGAASATITNTNSILFDLDAKAVGVSSALATAAIAGDVVNQFAISSGTSAAVLFSNTGTFSALLNATATDLSGNATARASIGGTGIEQSAIATLGGGGPASAAITNSGTVLFDLNGKALASTIAVATASVDGRLVDQFAAGTSASATLGNSGSFRALLNATATATGSGFVGNAFALATFNSVGLNQFALATFGSTPLASVSITNSGTMVLAAMASANGTTTARARASFSSSGDVVLQLAIGETASATLTNSGTFMALLDATASASDTASAWARFGDTGIEQSAFGTGGAGSSGTVSLTNSSTMTFAAMASAKGSNFASARATFGGDVFNQEASGETASATLTNSGAILAMLDADASAPTGTAWAFATITGDGIDQSARGTSGAGGPASATITNTSSILFDLDAKAVGFSSALAAATISGDVVNQFAFGTSAAVLFSNTGSFVAALNATATDLSGNATARASIGGTGINQDAIATIGAGGAASATLTNTGLLMFDLEANALASTPAIATAFIGGDVINQFASGTSALASFSNAASATFAVVLDADATATKGTATANATVSGTGIFQSANGDNSAGSVAAATITNSGTFVYNIGAFASGTDVATADANQNSPFIDQNAFNAVTASVSLVNPTGISLPFTVHATAMGGTNAFANGFIQSGIRQTATATTGAPSSATATLTNDGTISMVVSAWASAPFVASAFATFTSTMLYQGVFGGDTVSATFTNSGTFAVSALAHASGGTDVWAAAYLNLAASPNGIIQSASASDNQVSATALLTNSGTISMLAMATAIATDGLSGPGSSASASAGIFQYAISQNARSALDTSVTLTNTADIDVSAIAFASNADFAFARVEIESGIVQQVASGLSGSAAIGGTSTATLTNTSSFSLDYIGIAQAFGVTSAIATATNETYFIEQRVDNETASALIDNSGAISLLVQATAVASGNGTTGFASAKAYINTGILQVASANDGNQLSATATIDNDGSISMIAAAFASGTTIVSVSADINSGISQLVFNADNSAAVIDNSGTIDLIATGFGRGNDVNVSASITYGLYQVVTAGDDDISASATITNSGSILMLAQATAVGTNGAGGIGDTASAFASISTAIFQLASGANSATATLTNTADIDIFSFARATKADSASASAEIGYGISQLALGTTIASDAAATATLTNTSNFSLDFQVIALATGTSAAFASAEFDDTIIYQLAATASVASVLINNSGTINVLAQATAIATSATNTDTVEANASLDYGFYQFATANAGDQESASATITNTGTINLTATARATGLNTTTTYDSVSAFATVDSAFFQGASGGDDASATFTNSGTINVTATAFGRGNDVRATASVGSDVFDQEVDAGDDELTATALITNTGDINVLARATAMGTDGTKGAGSTAYAFASVSTFISQTADDANTATATVFNDGTMDIMALARAYNASSASATASIGYGIYQTARGTTAALDSSATVTLTNTSDLSIDFLALALATGITYAEASAEFDDTIVYQSARDANTATTLFTNDGTYSVLVQASASAAAGNAYASASIDYGISQNANANAGDQESATSTITNTGTISHIAIANAFGTGIVTAFATVDLAIDQAALSGDDVSTTVTNSGAMTFAASAFATGNDVRATASVDEGIEQRADAGDDMLTASALIDNSGTFILQAIATAAATNGASGPGATADAYASIVTFIEQDVEDAAAASATVTNDGTMTGLVMARATNANDAQATAYFNWGIWASVTATGGAGSTASASLTNTSDLSIDFMAIAFATGIANASAYATFGNSLIFQGAFNAVTATVSVDNSGTISGLAQATAIAAGNGTTGNATAFASFDAGISQSVSATGGAGSSATASVDNSGTFTMTALALAQGTTDADASAFVYSGIFQEANGAESNSVSVSNSGTMSFFARATATGSGTGIDADATASGVHQHITAPSTATTAVASFTNTSTGTFNVTAVAFASGLGGTDAEASAFAFGVSQSNFSSPSVTMTAAFSNSGSFTVQAFASATNATLTSLAWAQATGYAVYAGSSNVATSLSVTNSSTFQVNATALAGGTAVANAMGMSLHAGALSGSVSNPATISVIASAPGGSANATGIELDAAIVTATVTNTGTINVLAIGSTTAVGVRFGSSTLATHTIAPAGGEEGRFTNDGGSLWAGVMNGTLSRGTAIDTEDAPNTIIIDLQGSTQQGFIFGNMEISDDDYIQVTNGKTWFDGVVNTLGTLEGFMTISGSGTLSLAANTKLGPSVVNVETYTQTSDGTLAYEIHATNNTIGQVNAVDANLDGTVALIMAPGLYDTRTYEEVVTATNLQNGTWSSLQLWPTTGWLNPNSPLILLQAIYQPDQTVDLAMTVSFGDAACTPNQIAVGDGIDAVYSSSLTGASTGMLFEMFSLDQTGYCDAIEQLTGAEYAQNLRANLWSMNLLHYAVQDRVNAGPFSDDLRNDRNSVIQRGDAAFWASAQGSWADITGDINASGYDQKQYGIYAGVDFAVNDDLLLGFVVGYYDNELNFLNGNFKQDRGAQFGLYAAYDTQTFYLRGLVGLGLYNADSKRRISIVSTVGTAMASYDTRVWSFNAEAGRRFEIGNNTFLTPFAAVSYANARNDAFTETGVPAANLAASQNTAKSLTTDLGLRLSGAWESGVDTLIIPEVSFAWRHEFEDTPLFTSAFAAMPGSTFTVIGSVIDRDAIVVDAGLTIAKGAKFQIKASYMGRYNSQITEHGAMLRLTVKFDSN